MNERYEIQRELKKFFEKITLDNCGHLLQNHINKTEEQLKNRLKNNQKLEIVSSFYGSKAAIMQHIKDDLLSEDCLEQLTDYFLDQEWKDSYFLYFPIPIIVKKAKNYIYSGKWTITSIFPFPVGFSCWSY